MIIIIIANVNVRLMITEAYKNKSNNKNHDNNYNSQC